MKSPWRISRGDGLIHVCAESTPSRKSDVCPHWLLSDARGATSVSATWTHTPRGVERSATAA